MTAHSIAPARSPEDVDAVRTLLRAYAGSLGIDLGFQGFGAELAGLPGQYQPPGGVLLLARDGAGSPAGCVAVRPAAVPGACELKRLFVPAGGRGAGLGRALARAALRFAAAAGYRQAVLDTLGTMAEAQGLYRSLGFGPVPPYGGPAVPGMLYFGKPLAAPAFEIVSTAGRPDLAEVSARWRWDAFFRRHGRPLADTMEEALRTAAEAKPMPQTLMLLADGEPVGTASLVAHDLEERMELSPWLAGVFVVPEARGGGHAARLVAAVEAAARAGSAPELWLYTRTAANVYARLGWQQTEDITHNGNPYVLMRRDLSHPPAG